MSGENFDVDADLSLALLEQKHSDSLHSLICENRNHLREWLPWVDGVESIDDTSAFIQKTIAQNENGRGSHYLIETSGIPAGVIGFHPIDWPNRNAEIGYWLGERFTGKGFVTRAVKHLLAIGFSELALNRIEIRCASGNVSSRAVAERICMLYEGTLREEEWLYDHFVDHAVYSMLYKEFEIGNK